MPVLSDGDDGTRDLLQQLSPQGPQSDLIDLQIYHVAASGSGTLFAAGEFQRSFRGYGFYPVRAILLVSRDGGRSWEDSGLGYLGGGFYDVCTAGESDVWVRKDVHPSSDDVTDNLLASHDGGKTWEAYPVDMSRGHSPWSVGELSFSDSLHGRIAADYYDNYDVLVTSDGGRTWQYDHSETAQERTAAWESAKEKRKDRDSVRAIYCAGPSDSGDAVPALRLRQEGGFQYRPEAYVVERKNTAGVWQVLSRIPVQYRVLPGNRLVPVCPRQDETPLLQKWRYQLPT
jgi:hypothetical protein